MVITVIVCKAQTTYGSSNPTNLVNFLKQRPQCKRVDATEQRDSFCLLAKLTSGNHKKAKRLGAMCPEDVRILEGEVKCQSVELIHMG